MDAATTQIVFFGLLGVAVVVWFVGLMSVLKLRGLDAVDDASKSTRNAGEVVIDGEPTSVGKAILRGLRQPSLGMLGVGFRATEQTDSTLAVEKVGALICDQPAGLYFSEAVFELGEAGPGQTLVSYRLGDERLCRMLRRWGLVSSLVISLPILLLVAGLIGWLVVPNENPTVRWQVLQMTQVVVPLLVPYFFTWLVAMGRTQSPAYVESVLQTLDAPAAD